LPGRYFKLFLAHFVQNRLNPELYAMLSAIAEIPRSTVEGVERFAIMLQNLKSFVA